MAGNEREISQPPGPKESWDTFKDLFNNALGRKIADIAKDTGIDVRDLVKQAMREGSIIVVRTDIRIPEHYLFSEDAVWKFEEIESLRQEKFGPSSISTAKVADRDSVPGYTEPGFNRTGSMSDARTQDRDSVPGYAGQGNSGGSVGTPASDPYGSNDDRHFGGADETGYPGRADRDQQGGANDGGWGGIGNQGGPGGSSGYYSSGPGSAPGGVGGNGGGWWDQREVLALAARRPTQQRIIRRAVGKPQSADIRLCA